MARPCGSGWCSSCLTGVLPSAWHHVPNQTTMPRADASLRFRPTPVCGPSAEQLAHLWLRAKVATFTAPCSHGASSLLAGLSLPASCHVCGPRGGFVDQHGKGGGRPSEQVKHIPVCISIIYQTGQLSLQPNISVPMLIYPFPLGSSFQFPPCPRPRPLGAASTEEDMLMPTPAELFDHMAPNSILGKLHCIPRAFHWLRLCCVSPSDLARNKSAAQVHPATSLRS
ncbi:hypothetical protein HDV57DRAFT_314112 [Trichoderma longibrachiatum]